MAYCKFRIVCMDPAEQCRQTLHLFCVHAPCWWFSRAEATNLAGHWCHTAGLQSMWYFSLQCPWMPMILAAGNNHKSFSLLWIVFPHVVTTFPLSHCALWSCSSSKAAYEANSEILLEVWAGRVIPSNPAHQPSVQSISLHPAACSSLLLHFTIHRSSTDCSPAPTIHTVKYHSVNDE